MVLKPVESADMTQPRAHVQTNTPEVLYVTKWYAPVQVSMHRFLTFTMAERQTESERHAIPDTFVDA